MKENKCVNTLPLHVDSVIDSSRRDCVLPVMVDGLLTDIRTVSISDHVSLAPGSSHPHGLSLDLSVATSNGSTTASAVTEDHVSLGRPRYDFRVNSSTCVRDNAVGNSQALPRAPMEAIGSPLDDMMTAAYGDKLLYCDDGPRDSAWCQCWSVIVHHLGQHYSLPGGSIGKRYIDLLCVELQHLSMGTYHSECVIVFCSVMLQRNRLVRKGCDIRHLLERRMKL